MYELMTFLVLYGLKQNDAILAEDKHIPMYKEMCENYAVDYTAGGACQNTMRVAQWLVEEKNVFALMGCIGKDEFGEILESKAKEAGVLVSYQYHDTMPTGTCAVIITDKGANRSLCAYLSAANCFSRDHLDKPINQSLINDAQYFYITVIFLTVSPPSIMQIAEHACKNNKRFLMNLSAPFLCQFFKEPMMQALPYVDILFGNEQEAAMFSKEQNFGIDSIEDIALRISELPKKNTLVPRIVIITQGDNSVIMATEGKITLYPTVNVPPEEIVDTNGAGDAFVGGFLSRYVQKKPLDVCIKCGIYAATEVIKQSGCTLPEKPTFSL
ncbi:adenosine kinase 2 [Caerostris extrusa]|uniref:Adenosine kinase n=1 Tax=Caerostris extrusa TaxID=172846 RepID=A0AAV4PHH0_CAEEX|nr:adenosine kinase 2 [Caerostris extrusa]